MKAVDLHNPSAPHQVIVHVHAEVQEVLQTGECSGRPVAVTKFVLAESGKDKGEAVEKMNRLLERIRSCQT